MRKQPPAKMPVGVAVDEPPEEFRLPWWACAAAVTVAFIAYLPALRGPFLFDDLTLNPLQEGATQSAADYLRGVRPIYYTSLWLDRALFGVNPFASHLTNWLLHVANSFLALMLLRRLSAGMEAVAAFGAGLFLLHPLNTEAVSYIASRSEVLSVFFAFSAYLLFLRARERGMGWGRVAAILALLALGAGTKEHVFAVAPLMLLTDLFFWRGSRLAAIRAHCRLYLPLLAGSVAGGLVVLRLAASSGTVGASLEGVTPLMYFATQCRVVWHYARLFVMPWPQNIDHALAFSPSLADPMALLGLLALLAALGACWWKRREARLTAFGMAAFLVLLAPTSSFIPIADAMAERRLYLPMIGLVLALAPLVLRARGRWAALALVLVVFASFTWHRNDAWTSAVAMWQSSVETNPRNGRAHFQLAHALYNEGRCREAVEHYAKAAGLGQHETALYVDWGLALDCDGRPGEAAAMLKRAAGMADSYAAFATLGMVEGKRGRAAEALEALDEALRLNPRFDMSWVYRGNVLFTLGRRDEAAEAFRKALELNPRNGAARQGLAATGSR